MRRLVVDIEDLVDTQETDINALMSTIESYRQDGFELVLTSSAGMLEFDGNVGKIPGSVGPDLFEAVRRLCLDYDELVFGRPDCGPTGLVLDDKAVTPDEFVSNDYRGIQKLLCND